jgi:hypothetical protein
LDIFLMIGQATATQQANPQVTAKPTTQTRQDKIDSNSRSSPFACSSANVKQQVRKPSHCSQHQSQNSATIYQASQSIHRHENKDGSETQDCQAGCCGQVIVTGKAYGET